MAPIDCPQCGKSIDDRESSCPRCGLTIERPTEAAPMDMSSQQRRRGYEWKSRTVINGWPLVHIAAGRNPATGKLYVAKGIIAIGQFGVGFITIAQFGIGFLFGFGQFTAGILAIGQFSLGIYFGVGQFATGFITIGMFALGKYVLALFGLGEHVWSVNVKDPEAIEFFKNLWNSVQGFLGR